MPSLREPTAQAGEGSEAFSLASDPRLSCGLRLYFEALHGSSPQHALQSYFRPQPKSATANYTANNGEGACSARLETPERGAKTDFSPGQSHEPPRGGPGSPAARPRARNSGGWERRRRRRRRLGVGSGGRLSPWGRGAAGGGIPSRPGTARRALPGGEGGGARPSGRLGVPAALAGPRPAGGRASGAGLCSAPHPGGGRGVSEPRAGPRRPPSQPLQRGQARGRPDAGQQRRQSGGGETRAASQSPREPKPTRPRPSAPRPRRHAAGATHPALAALVPARVGVGPVHGERRVAARHRGARAGNFPVSRGRRAASCQPCSGRPGSHRGAGGAGGCSWCRHPRGRPAPPPLRGGGEAGQGRDRLLPTPRLSPHALRRPGRSSSGATSPPPSRAET